MEIIGIRLDEKHLEKGLYWASRELLAYNLATSKHMMPAKIELNTLNLGIRICFICRRKTHFELNEKLHRRLKKTRIPHDALEAGMPIEEEW